MRVSSWYLLAVVLLGMTVASGCGSTLLRSGESRAIKWRQIVETDMKTLNQDVDLWMMMDRPTRLTAARAN